MYLKSIWLLNQQKGIAKTTKISSLLKVAPSSVTEMLQKLQKGGYIVHLPYRGCTLTEKGTNLAVKVVRRERLLRKFLFTVLKLPKEVVREQACRLEHYLTDQAAESLCKFLDCPDQCPVDDLPIPQCLECMD